MKKTIAGAFVLLASTLSISSQAQRIKLVDGDLTPLASESQINVEFSYDNMKVGKFDNESDYIAKKTEDYNKKEPGRGDNWAKAWVADRESRFEPKFYELFEKSSGITPGKFPSSKYTLVFHTVSTEPGYNVGIMRGNAEINSEIQIVETANKSKVVAKLTMSKALGRTFGGYDFDTGLRISEAYADGGKALGKYIKSNSR